MVYFDFNDMPLSWVDFQQASPHTQGLMAVALLDAAVKAKGEFHIQQECRYVRDVNAGTKAPVNFQPICAIGWALFELEGKPSGFESRDEFLLYLTVQYGVNDTMGERLGFHPATVLAFLAAQEVADNGGTWGTAALMARRINNAALVYCQDHPNH